eukprot:Lankesteria_metandrocarpae@DN7276_c0_g1_i1.p1
MFTTLCCTIHVWCSGTIAVVIVFYVVSIHCCDPSSTRVLYSVVVVTVGSLWIALVLRSPSLQCYSLHCTVLLIVVLLPCSLQCYCPVRCSATMIQCCTRTLVLCTVVALCLRSVVMGWAIMCCDFYVIFRVVVGTSVFVVVDVVDVGVVDVDAVYLCCTFAL